MLKVLIGTAGVVLILLGAATLSFFFLQRACSLQKPTANLAEQLNQSRPNDHAKDTNSGESSATPQGQEARPTATFKLRVTQPNEINGSYYAEEREGEKEDWMHRFWCDTKIGEFIIAIFTIVLAGFTGALWFSTNRLYKATTDAVTLAREEFVATHRPRIIVYGMEVSLPGDDKPRHIHFRYVNTGDTDASVTFIESRVVYAKAMVVPAGIELRRHDVITQPILVRSGENGFAITLDGAGFLNLVRSGKDGIVFCVGIIAYRDSNDIERRTGFCRWFDSQAERWKKLEDDDYEYAY